MSQGQLSTDLETAIRDQFPNQVSEARQILLSYCGREADRVRRGIVALSNGQWDLLVHYTRQAVDDYRDILYWSEYPDEFPGANGGS
ncbi:MAG: hypothetical protein AB7O59_16280 [Pirellulales bacterium]